MDLDVDVGVGEVSDTILAHDPSSGLHEGVQSSVDSGCKRGEETHREGRTEDLEAVWVMRDE